MPGASRLQGSRQSGSNRTGPLSYRSIEPLADSVQPKDSHPIFAQASPLMRWLSPGPPEGAYEWQMVGGEASER
jgi:hypothetical protein